MQPSSRRNPHQAPAACAEPLEGRRLFSARVVGYLPDYRYAAMINKLDWSAVTHINYFAIRRNSNGTLGASSSSGFSFSQLDTTVAAAHAHGVTVSIVIDPGSAFTTIAASASLRLTFVSNIAAFSQAHQVDGIDLDWEPAWGTATVTDINNYGMLINELNTGAPNLLITSAVNPLQVPTDSGNRYVVPLSAVNSLDYINVMGYDFTIPDHSSYSQSINALVGWGNYVSGAGVAKSRVVLGMPFYAHTSTSWGDVRTYDQIIDTYAPAPNLDNTNGWYFNGQDTIRNKTQYVVTNGYGGVMMWELGQDHFDVNGNYTTRSLLPIIKSVINADVTRPIASNGQLDFNARPQAVTVAFSEDVLASLQPGDLQLFNQTTTQTIPAADITFAYNTNTNTATFTFPNYQYGALPDGNYVATLPAASVSDAAGNTLASDFVFNFFFKNGDANRDTVVNANDFSILASNFGQSNRVFSQGDFNYDGFVNANDFSILASRFGTALGSTSASTRAGPTLLPKLMSTLPPTPFSTTVIPGRRASDDEQLGLLE